MLCTKRKIGVSMVAIATLLMIVTQASADLVTSQSATALSMAPGATTVTFTGIVSGTGFFSVDDPLIRQGMRFVSKNNYISQDATTSRFLMDASHWTGWDPAWSFTDWSVSNATAIDIYGKQDDRVTDAVISGTAVLYDRVAMDSVSYAFSFASPGSSNDRHWTLVSTNPNQCFMAINWDPYSEGVKSDVQPLSVTYGQSAVPEPAALPTLCAALAGFVAYAWRKRR